jgi:hypothetical protein
MGVKWLNLQDLKLNFNFNDIKKSSEEPYYKYDIFNRYIRAEQLLY